MHGGHSNKYTKEGTIPTCNATYGRNYKPHKNADMIESTSFLLSNGKEENLKKGNSAIPLPKLGKLKPHTLPE